MKPLMVLASAWLIGCVGGPSKFEVDANRALDVDLDRCKQLAGAKANGECWTAAMRNFWGKLNLPHRDQMELIGAERIAVGEKLDTGKISKAEYDVVIARMNSASASVVQNREVSNSIANSAAASAAAANAPRTCRPIGRAVTCD